MRVKIGEDAKEQLEIIPAQFFVRRTIRLRYACPQCGSCAAELKADKVGKIPTWQEDAQLG
jgi:transposase